ncbi:MAG: hypothetical protein CMG00_07615 [Candidatus Marinimicrobia bacterium]|nr:hypothetical protein [Candidatus Neomarinimicrobiota bacterium]
MPGGTLNLIATGAENVILNSNPKKTFFKATYAKHTNFGLQKFRLNQEKQRELDFINETEFDFKIPRYADLLNDTFVCVTLPNIYSTLYYDAVNAIYVPFEFNWVENLGTTMIKEIQITAGGLTLAKYSGEYIHCISHRDLSKAKKDVFDQMIGHVPELYDPANGDGLSGTYPNAYYNSNTTSENSEPSIRQRKLFIPLNSWFSRSSKLSLPLISLQYQEIQIKIRFRPVKELYTIMDVEKATPTRIAPDPNNTNHQLRRFLRKPLASDRTTNPSITARDRWFADVHLMSTYVFLDEPERQVFARQSNSILIKQVIEYDFLKRTGSRKIDVKSRNCVSNYMFRFRRSDAFTRNQWTNYTNWSYTGVRPQPLIANGTAGNTYNGSGSITGDVGNYPVNLKYILLDMALVLNGEYRENILDSGVYLYCEKYTKTSGTFKEGLYHYSFAQNTNINEYQPSGSMNMSKYDKITFEFNTIDTPVNPNSNTNFICNNSGQLIGIRKPTEDLNQYNFDFKVFEEKYNVITFSNGNVNLLYTN